MATIKKLRYQDESTFGGVPYGNTTARSFNLTTKSNGAAVNSDTATAIADGDSVVLGLLPAGMLLQDAIATVSDAFTALIVSKLGFAYADGVDSTEVPQDDDYFFAAATLTLHTAGTYRKVTPTAPVRLPKDANLVLVSSGAAHASVGIADFRIVGVLGGPN
jgi:hypothetical protein